MMYGTTGSNEEVAWVARDVARLNDERTTPTSLSSKSLATRLT